MAVLIVNASPRAPRSNSKRYGEIFSEYCQEETVYFPLSKTNHEKICEQMEQFSKMVIVFPLYADGLPVTLLHFLKTLEQNPPSQKPVVSVLINCGFFEPRQNDIAVSMLELFCKRHGYPFGAVLKIGSGEAILDTPFQFFLKRKMKKFAAAVTSGKNRTFSVTMPIPKSVYLKASTNYWIAYGKKNGVTPEQMDTMLIEGK